MIPFSEAFDLLLKHTSVLATERVRIEDAAGRVLRQEISADRDSPPFDRVMMDGFALRASDFAQGRRFLISGSAPAGRATACLPERTRSCLEIMTGAPMPVGADCIVPVEDVVRSGEEIMVDDSFEPQAGRFIHWAGSDARAGDRLLAGGVRLGCREIGIAASCGAAWIEVSRLPRVAVLATGDELVQVDETPAPHQIRQSNAHAIACALRRSGIPPAKTGTISDAPEQRQLVRTFLADHDWLLLTGAVSKGAHDFVPDLLDSLGCEKLFHGIAQRPGKPAGCWLGPSGQIVVALPGNPVSALTGLHALVLPVLAVSMGMPLPPPRLVTLAEPVRSLPGMTHHLPVALGVGDCARPAPTGNSGDFIGLLKSSGFVTVPPGPVGPSSLPFTPWT